MSHPRCFQLLRFFAILSALAGIGYALVWLGDPAIGPSGKPSTPAQS